MSTNIEEGLVYVNAGRVALEGNLLIPDGARGLVMFAHGSGSSRFSSRNRYVADVLRRSGVGTLLIDLLTRDEESIDLRTAHLRFDIGLLADRLVGASEWLAKESETRTLKVGLFGASTGGGAALVAAARVPERIAAVVSRGGRPDLAGPALRDVVAPTLLIVGGRDQVVLDLNRTALAELGDGRELAVVPDATHLFEESGALDEVARLAAGWFVDHLA